MKNVRESIRWVQLIFPFAETWEFAFFHPINKNIFQKKGAIRCFILVILFNDSNLFFATFPCNLFLWQRRRFKYKYKYKYHCRIQKLHALLKVCDSCSVGWHTQIATKVANTQSLSKRKIFRFSQNCANAIDSSLFDHDTDLLYACSEHRFKLPFRWQIHLQFIEIKQIIELLR